MALTLFPTKICLKFASVPVPEAHKYVIPPISYFARSPFRSTPSLSRRHPPPLPLRRRLTVTLAQPLTCFCGVVVARGNIRGNTVNHLSRKKTQCNIPAETPLRMSLLLSSPLLSSPFPRFVFVPNCSRNLSRNSPLFRFFEEGEGGRIARAISQPPYCIGKNGLKWQTHALL